MSYFVLELLFKKSLLHHPKQPSLQEVFHSTCCQCGIIFLGESYCRKNLFKRMNNILFSSWAYTGPVLSCVLRNNFDDPVDRAQDIITLNMKLLGWPGAEMWKQWLAQHHNTDYNKLAETMIIPETWNAYYKMTEQGILVNRTHVFMVGYVSPWEISLGRHPELSPRMNHKGGEVWYRSQERVDNFPYAGYLSRKDWRYNEVN